MRDDLRQIDLAALVVFATSVGERLVEKAADRAGTDRAEFARAMQDGVGDFVAQIVVPINLDRGEIELRLVSPTHGSCIAASEPFDLG